jgi:hypothetical protein
MFGNGFIRFHWTNPDVAAFAGVIIFRHRDPDRALPIDTPGNTPTDGTAPQTYLGGRDDNAVAVLTVPAATCSPARKPCGRTIR